MVSIMFLCVNLLVAMRHAGRRHSVKRFVVLCRVWSCRGASGGVSFRAVSYFSILLQQRGENCWSQDTHVHMSTYSLMSSLRRHRGAGRKVNFVI